jgi:predicted transcriptional regulator
VEDYLKNVKMMRHQGLDFTAFVEEDNTLAQCAEKLVRLHIHRVWIVDKQKKPIGVVTLTDIIWELIGEK